MKSFSLALAVLSELFKRDGNNISLSHLKDRIFYFLERCVLRFLCSHSNDGGILIDSMESLNKIFDQYKNHSDIARGIISFFE